MNSSKTTKDLLILASLVTSEKSQTAVLQEIVNRIVVSFDINSAVIFHNDQRKRKVYSKTFTDNTLNKIAIKIIGKSFVSLNVSYDDRDNYVVKSILGNEILKSNSLYDFTKAVFSESLSNKIQRLVRVKELIVLPIRYRSKTFGALLVTRVEENISEVDLTVLRKYIRFLAVTLHNLEQYNSVRNVNYFLQILHSISIESHKYSELEDFLHSIKEHLISENLFTRFEIFINKDIILKTKEKIIVRSISGDNVSIKYLLSENCDLDAIYLKQLFELVFLCINKFLNEEKLRKTNYDLDLKVKELDNAILHEKSLIDILGHELRTPLSVINLNLKLIKNITTDSPITTRINDATKKSIHIVNLLINSSRLNLGSFKMDLKPLSISQLFKKISRDYEFISERKGIRFAFISRNSKFRLLADESHLTLVLDNLVGNAVKYTDEGQITIQVKEIKNSMLKVTIKDTGRGIPKEALPKLGEKFFRVDNYIPNKTDRELDIVRPGGTGLGLYVSFGLIRLMGGEVEVKSELGKGSEFSFTLPKFTGQEPSGGNKIKHNVFERLGLEETESKDITE